MKLSVEEKKELAQLAGYFKKLEITSQHLGMDLDDLISEYRDDGFAQYPEPEPEKSNRRKETFQKAGKKEPEKAKASKVK